MSLTEKPKFLTALIVALLLLNFGTLAFLWTHGPGQHGPERGPDVFHFIVHELMMTDAQQKQYAEMRDEHHAKIEELHRQSRDLHDKLFFLLQSPAPDSSMVDKVTDSIAANQKQEELITFHHFAQVRAMCTPEQQKKFDEIISEALRMMAPPPAPPPGRR